MIDMHQYQKAQKKPTYAAASAHRAEPPKHNLFWTVAALLSTFSSSEHWVPVRFDMPSAQAANAQDNVSP